MQHLKIWGVTGNLLAVAIAVLTVSYGKKYAFVVSCTIGILFEAMVSSVGGVFVVAYPVIGMLFAQLFADMSDEKRERLLLRQSGTQKKIKGDMNPYLRILLDSVCIAAGIEFISLFYVNLSATDVSPALYLRAVLSFVYTGFLSVLLMWPARRLLGLHGSYTRL